LLAVLATAGSKCPRKKGLSSSRRAMEQNTARWCHFKALEYLGVKKWKKGHLLEGMDIFHTPSDR
jgi:hypothetical protein